MVGDDVSVAADIRRMVADVEANIGAINILVNNGADGRVAYFAFETTYTKRKRPVPVLVTLCSVSGGQ
jgi:NAD(P)-dependent dehydrogenase (short-subunit alcohol dehydrogenase family)